jgi:flavin reductase (DIM6/NTAB) family NADH-FMN oxidoreductase RutF
VTRDINKTDAERTLFDHSNTSTRDFYKLITAAIVPRPIAWVSSRSATGVDNLAPFSFFSVSSTDPLVVQFTAVGGKHSADNAAATGQFVINVATESMMDQVNATSAGFTEDVDEFAAVGVASAPATAVDCLRVRDSPVAIECELLQIIDVGNSQVVMGRVVAVTVDPAVTAADGHPDFTKLAPVSRLGRIEWGLPGEVVERERPEA